MAGSAFWLAAPVSWGLPVEEAPEEAAEPRDAVAELRADSASERIDEAAALALERMLEAAEAASEGRPAAPEVIREPMLEAAEGTLPPTEVTRLARLSTLDATSEGRLPTAEVREAMTLSTWALAAPAAKRAVAM